MPSDADRIDALHRADEAASRARDFATLRSLFSDDAVVLPPGGAPIRGRAALDASFAAMARAVATTEVLAYAFEWHEVEVCGSYAFEWGVVVGRERDLATGAITAERHHVMRILQRQPGGDWKVHRTIWNASAG